MTPYDLIWLAALLLALGLVIREAARRHGSDGGRWRK